jgi:hypothetical protein
MRARSVSRSLFSFSLLLTVAAASAGGCGSTPKSGGFGSLGSSSGGGGAGDDSGSGLGAGGGSSGGGLLIGASGGKDAGGDGAGGAAPATTLIDHCSTGAPSGLTAAKVQALLAGGSAGSMRYLYPYAHTVFPRGLISPTVMWDGASADFVYVHLKSKVFEYKGCLVPTAAGQVQIPQDVWTAASAHTSGAADPFSLSLTTISSSTVTGPVTEPIVIAPATLKGSIFYNSYQSKLVSTTGGAVLRIVPGQNVQVFLGQSGCNGCHAVSADGSRMVADPFMQSVGGSGASYTLTLGIAPNPAPLVANAPNGTFVGLTPDGKLYLGNAHPNNGFGGPRSGGPLAVGPVNSQLYETDTGNAVNNSNIPAGAMMPMFSPDGKQLVFNDLAIAGSAAGQGLATMAFDEQSRTASGYKKIFQVTDTSKYPGWPFFLPDERAVVFAIGAAADYSGSGAGLGVGGMVGLAGAPASDVYLLDLSTGTSTMLAKAMGFKTTQDAASNTTYLPFGASEETHHNYYPTVSPVAAGGYFWMFFDSYRHYGNVGLQRQLWGAAIDVLTDGRYTVDPSHPPFYVTGQELGTGNHRAFTALDPCHADGSSCTTGVDCCKGYCTNGVCGLPAQPRCSNTDEACGPGHACCNAQEPCINGFCAVVLQ